MAIRSGAQTVDELNAAWVGVEAHISHVKRSFGFRRTRLRRLAGAQTWAGLGIFAYNLQRMTVLSQ